MAAKSKAVHSSRSIKLVFLGAMAFTLCVVIPSSIHFQLKHPPDENRHLPVVFDRSEGKSNKRSKVTAVNPKKGGTSKAKSAATAVHKTPGDGIDWSDSIFKRWGWDNDPVVIESHKLVFFTVPKNACTTFKKLFRRMMGYPDWFNKSPHNPSKNGLKYLGNYPKEKQREFMTSPDWTRAIFVRDPLERLLSAYMDKALKKGPPYWQPPVNGAHLKQLCCNMKGANETKASRQKWKQSSLKFCHEEPFYPYETALTQENFPFETFVVSVMAQCQDPHWSPQYQRMKEPTNWKFINFVGRFEDKMADTHRLLKKIGAFEEFGAEGWGEATGHEVPDANGKNRTSLSIFESNPGVHKTGSANKMDLHYTEKVRKLVFEHFRKDYELELFNFTSPILER